MMEAARISETSVYFNETTLCYILEGYDLSYSLPWEPEMSHTIANFYEVAMP
jgi:hypothetical protein